MAVAEQTIQQPCRRCQAEPAAITIRNEPLCKDCFANYVRSKIIKRMESFRVRHASLDKTRTLLLPLSLGAGSVTLLQVLSRYLKGQVERTGRTGFALQVLHIHDEDVKPSSLGEIKASFPEHSFTAMPLQDAMSLPSVQDLFPASSSETGSQHLSRVLNSCTSATARADIVTSLRTKLIVSYAKSSACECIIFGHSTTRLAEQVLAETAKGRGFAMHLSTADGAVTHGLPFYYPCRDLLSTETTSYLNMLGLSIPFVESEVNNAVSSKQTTIDSLMQSYFATVEKDHPSIVANVVRTAAKLEGDALALVQQQCELCEMPLVGNAPPRSRVCTSCTRIMPG